MSSVNNLLLDDAGETLIKQFEGYSETPYQDSAGIWTIGYGHTEEVTKNTPPLVPEQAEQFFEEDIKSAEHTVNQAVTIVLNQGEFNALVSFTFNEGSEAFLGSTLLQKLNNGRQKGCGKRIRQVGLYPYQRKTGYFRRPYQETNGRSGPIPNAGCCLSRRATPKLLSRTQEAG